MSRVLMIVLGTVLLANAGLGLYLALRKQPPDEPAPVLTTPELGRELALLKKSKSQGPASAVPADPVAPSGAASETGLRAPVAGTGSAADAESVAPQTPELGCFYWGPFRSEIEARKRLSELQESGAITAASGARVSRTSVQRDPDFMIFIGPFPSLGAARAARDELKAQGSEAHVVTRNERLVVSTGVFSQRRFAAAQTTKLRDWGYEPQQSELIRSQRLYFLLADIVSDDMAATDTGDGGAAGRCDDIASQYGIL